MGNRSRFIVGAAAVGVGFGLARRRRRQGQLRLAFDGIRDSVMPSYPSANTPVESLAEDSPAPGHQHLPPPSEGSRRSYPLRPLPRPFAKYHGFRHPV